MKYIFTFLIGFALATCYFQPDYTRYKRLIKSCEDDIPVQCKIVAIPVPKKAEKAARTLPYCDTPKCLKT